METIWMLPAAIAEIAEGGVTGITRRSVRFNLRHTKEAIDVSEGCRFVTVFAGKQQRTGD
jgi:hypothetical protein